LNVVRLAVVAGLISVSLSRLGVIGAVLAAVLAMAVAKAMALLKIKELMSVDAGNLLPWKQLAAIAVAAAVSCAGPLLLHGALSIPAFFLLALSGLSYAAIYCGFLIRWNLLSAAERVALAGWLPSFTAAGLEAKAVRNLSEG
jgi:hypothetical protein